MTAQGGDPIVTHSGIGVSLRWLLLAVAVMIVAALAAVMALRELPPPYASYLAWPMILLIGVAFLAMYFVIATVDASTVSVTKRSLAGMLLGRRTAWRAPLSDVAWIRCDSGPGIGSSISIGSRSNGDMRFHYNRTNDDMPGPDVFTQALSAAAIRVQGGAVEVRPNVWLSPAYRTGVVVFITIAAFGAAAALYLPIKAETAASLVLCALFFGGYAALFLYRTRR